MGIRCELFSHLLKKRGFENVHQLGGGVLKYGVVMGSESEKHWKGGLFVFDDRLVVAVDGDAGNREVVSGCRHCGVGTDMVYNCANNNCNEVFVSCLECAREHLGCCSESCRDTNRKPFRPRNGDQWGPKYQ